MVAIFDVGVDWKPKHEELKRLVKSPKNFTDAILLALELHCLVHAGEMSGSKKKTYCDEIYDGLLAEDYSIMPSKRDVTLAWNIWHITRIEDLVGNILMLDSNQVFDSKWQKRLGTSVTDTGNAMTDEEIISLSRQLDKAELKNYRTAVGRQTQKLLKSLQPEDLKRKPKAESLQKLMQEGGLTEQQGSFWLLDFWGKKTFAGLILLPLTRHHIMHLDDCIKLKQKIKGAT